MGTILTSHINSNVFIPVILLCNSLKIEDAALLITSTAIHVWIEFKNASGASRILTTFKPSSKSENVFNRFATLRSTFSVLDTSCD